MPEPVPQHLRTAEFVAQGLYAVNSFKELEARISTLPTDKDKGDALEVFADAFLVTQRGVDPDNYWPQGRIQLSVRETLELPKTDYGVDSVYLNSAQGYDACQCKFRSGRPTLTYEDIAHLLASARDDKFQNKVVFTNSDLKS
jgi:predicted helicase